MAKKSRKPQFSIYQTASNIEINQSNNRVRNGILICTCDYYQSALRIAQEISLIRKTQLRINL